MILQRGLSVLCALSALSVGVAAFADCGQVVVVRVNVNVVANAGPWMPPPPPVMGGGPIVIQQQQQQQQQVATAYPPNIPEFMNIPADGSGLAGRSLRTFKEPDQYAVIAWNGKEELLTLMTKQSSLQGSGAALNVLPLPGRPISVKPGDKELFTKARAAVARKLDLASRPVELEAKIGAHNIFVIYAESTDQFVTEVNAYVAKKFENNARAMVTEQLRDVIDNYVKRGFKYFAFDLIQQGTEAEVKQAIEYKFESPYVYYPMYVSRLGGKGKTTLQAVVFTREILKQTAMQGLPASKVQSTQSVQFSEQDLNALGDGGAEIVRLLGPGGTLGRQWTVTGELDGFVGDIMMRP